MRTGFALAFAGFVAMSAGIVLAAPKYQINNGGNAWIYEHTVCKNVANASGFSLMVPTQNAAGWASFYNNSHVGVTITDPSCAATNTVACGTAINNQCGVSCGTTGTGLNAGQCHSVGCGTNFQDNCGNNCGYGYTPCCLHGDELVQGGGWISCLGGCDTCDPNQHCYAGPCATGGTCCAGGYEYDYCGIHNVKCPNY